MTKTLIGLAVVLTGCSTAQLEKMNAFAASPAGQALIRSVETTALVAATSAVQQYADTGKVEGKEVAQASLSSVSLQLRGLQATSGAADPAAIKDAVKNGSASPGVTKKVAPAVAQSVAAAVQKGLSADVANEAAARGLDKAATKHNK